MKKNTRRHCDPFSKSLEPTNKLKINLTHFEWWDRLIFKIFQMLRRMSSEKPMITCLRKRMDLLSLFNHWSYKTKNSNIRFLNFKIKLVSIKTKSFIRWQKKGRLYNPTNSQKESTQDKIHQENQTQETWAMF